MAIFNSNGQIIDTVNEKAQVTNPIALEFDNTASYNVGDYVSYNGSIYKCNTEIGSGGDGSWIAGHWDEVKVGDEISSLKEDLWLLSDEIPDTTQTYTFSEGSVSQVTHSRNGAVVRTDAFTYGESTITEIRTLNTGESLTIVTNLTTLETSVTYAAA